MPPKEDWEKYKPPVDEDEIKQEEIVPLSDEDIQVLKTYVSVLVILRMIFAAN
jgi:26S proteasome regulatory subunit T1